METIQKISSSQKNKSTATRRARLHFVACMVSLLGSITLFMLALVTESALLYPFYLSLSIVGLALVVHNISYIEIISERHASTPDSKTR